MCPLLYRNEYIALQKQFDQKLFLPLGSHHLRELQNLLYKASESFGHQFTKHASNLSRHKSKILSEIQAIIDVFYLKHNPIQPEKILLSP